MRPTKAKTLINKTAVDLNLSPILVQDVVDFYYSTVRKKMESLEHPTLFLHNLGTLRLSANKLKNNIQGLTLMLNSNNQEDFKRVVKYNFTQALLDKKEKALSLCTAHYKTLYEKRNKNLEGKRKDLRGDKEQPL